MVKIMSMPALLILASKVADLRNDICRKAFIGAVAVRADGTLVSSRNGSTQASYPVPTPSVHAEARLTKKCGCGASVYVARIRRDGSLGCAKPCSRCLAVMRSHRVEVVYYTIDNKNWDFCSP